VAGELQFEVSTDKLTYQPGTDILVRLQLTNSGQDPLIVNSRLALNRPHRSGEVWLEVTGPEGQLVPFSAMVNVGTPTPDDLAILKPSRSAGKQYVLQTYYNTLAAPGEYTLKGTYRNTWGGEDLAAGPAWTGTLSAEPVQFKIAEADAAAAP